MGLFHVLLLGAALAACQEHKNPTATTPRIVVVSGGPATDTISSPLPSPLVVRIIGGDGNSRPGVRVDFEAPAIPGCTTTPYSRSIGDTCTGVVLARFGGSGSLLQLSDTTDSEGRASAQVILGMHAGVAILALTVPAFGLSDTVRYTVLPGAAVGVRTTPRDTALEPGDVLRLHAGVVDRADNVRLDAVTFESSSPAVQVDAAGRAFGASIGRAYLFVRGILGGTTRSDSTGVTIVPRAEFAVSMDDGSLILRRLAGPVRRILTSGPAYSPAWSPAGDRLVFGGVAGLASVDTVGTVASLPTPGVTRPSWPQYSRDGIWIYFQGETIGARMYRVHPDGTGLEAVPAHRSNWDVAATPSPSPDGRRVAFSAGGILILTLATGQIDTVLVSDAASGVRWSPDGQWIAYQAGAGSGVGLVHPDGTGAHVLPGHAGEWLTWSPDSRWVVASGGAGASLIDVAAGVLLPLPTAGGLHLAWRP